MLGAALAPLIGHQPIPPTNITPITATNITPIPPTGITPIPAIRHQAYSGEPGPERRNIDYEEEPSCNSVCL